MKNMTIKWRIMLWHTTILVLLLASTFPIMYLIISNRLYTNANTDLKSESERISKLLGYNDKPLQLYGDLNSIQTGVYISFYSNDNVPISGTIPQNIGLNEAPLFNNIYTEVYGDHKLIVYDSKLIRHGETVGWLRAVKSLDAISEALDYFRAVIYIIIPIFIAVTVIFLLGGGLIKKALSPVRKITVAAMEVGQGDMSKRIHFDGSRDEVGRLAESFDDMLDRLEDSFNREKHFSSNVSHELRTPVTAIIVNAEEALNGDKTADEYKENLNAILKEGRRMNSLISQLLMMARSNDGKHSYEMESIDISTLTKTIVTELAKTVGHPDIFISYDIEEGIVMLVEQTLYMRLLINLVDNALKYNQPGGWIKVSLSKSKSHISLSVADSGIGISKEDMPNIWDRFFKADQSGVNSSPGLGLSIVKWIAELHGGTVHIKSEPNKGSLFEIRFQTKWDSIQEER